MSLRLRLAQSLLQPVYRLRRTFRFPVSQRILMYHAVGSLVPMDRQGRYTVEPLQFFKHMKKLVASGLRVGPLGTPDAEVAITFDDGYRDNLTNALPVLERFGLPFTVFVTPDFVRSGDRLYLNSSELRELASDSLVTIGAHGDTHTRLTDLDDYSLHEELGNTKAWLENVTGRPVTKMSYPHGAVDARVRAAVAKAGFTLACTSEFGGNEPKRDPLALRRIDVWSRDDEVIFESKLLGDWDWMRFFTRCGV